MPPDIGIEVLPDVDWRKVTIGDDRVVPFDGARLDSKEVESSFQTVVACSSDVVPCKLSVDEDWRVPEGDWVNSFVWFHEVTGCSLSFHGFPELVNTVENDAGNSDCVVLMSDFGDADNV